MTLCVYALAGRGVGRIVEPGLAGERLRALRVGAVEAIVGDVTAIPRPTERNLRKYGRLLSSLWTRTPALLPARFGTTMRDRAELELVLGARQDALRRRLRMVRNRAQMTIRIVRGEGSGQPAAGSGQGKAIRNRESRGRRYLEERARTAHDVPEFTPVRPAVQRWVREERVERRGNIATIYHLVPRIAAGTYRDAIRRAARDAQVRLLVSGPWPPYAFADSW